MIRRACLSPGADVAAAVKMAEAAVVQLQETLKRFTTEQAGGA